MTSSQTECFVQTNTNENYFPQRLIYRVDDHPKLVDILNNLNCVFQAPNDNRWYVQCSDEMLKIHKWGKSYLNAVKANDPIVVAIICIPNPNTMHVYLRSFQRVVPTLGFLDIYIPAGVAQGTHHDVCFKIILAKNAYNVLTPEQVFANESNIKYSDNMRQVDALEEKARLTGRNYNDQIDTFFLKDYLQLQAQAGAYIADLERKRLEIYYRDGVQDYQQAMEFQEMLALARHYAGGTLNAAEFMEKLIRNEGKPITDLQRFLEI